MLKLCGFAASNYYNKVKLALLEKNVPFEEVLAWIGETDLNASPLGKVPYIIADGGTLCESEVIAEYLEAAYPQTPLLPADPLAAGKVRELVTYMELYLELTVRELYPEAFFGGKVSDGVKERQQKLLTRYIPAFAKLAKFSPYVAGDSFTLADCAAVVHLPLVSACTRIIYGTDMLADLPVKDYLKRMSERPTVQKVNADRKTNTELMLSRNKP
ncbi:glutathione S-transferase [Cupriavidus gilardii]|uniref:Glutathione S-transferase n=1 Tax=Cupriavidus gilardii TaxID=82541 RepID=A0ABY4VSC9_9BURK|nr:glutathione S-transferase [Cupriavidus gilardii]MCT9072643.1 glutathione S-transferase [Cupriavidus gilardii]QKS63266.1 glutathione S-transferase [Cupriavidus gilardii]QQE07665.1 glutathione S-transferase [Cupriavidus sp. ISTL7]USE79167.1 glutathione S-transferase [Cupriavidus gilardii]